MSESALTLVRLLICQEDLKERGVVKGETLNPGTQVERLGIENGINSEQRTSERNKGRPSVHVLRVNSTPQYTVSCLESKS